MTLIVIRQNLTMAVNRQMCCGLGMSSHLRSLILYGMIFHHRSVSPLIYHYPLTSCQIAKDLRELSVFHSVIILYHLDIDVWEIDL
jgi:hypothetical protein